MRWNLADFQVHVQPGDGVVAALGGALLVVPAVAPAQEATLDQLLAAAEEAATAGRQLARRLARILAVTDEPQVPPFCLLVGGGGPLIALLQGPVELEALGPAGELHLSGLQASTWVDRTFSEEFESLTVRGVDATGAAPDRRSDLRAGVTRGGGVLLTRRAAASTTSSAEEEPDSEAARQEPEEPGPATAPLADADIEPAAPTDLATSAGADRRGILCPARHLNDPDARACAVCGAPLVHETVLAPGGTDPAAWAGRLVLEGGPAVLLDRDCVIGRDPRADPDVEAGRARGFALDDPDHRISRTHAKVTVAGGAATLTDLDSRNGTFITPPGESGWTPLRPREPVPFVAGSRIRLGRHVLAFEPPAAGAGDVEAQRSP